VFFCTIMFVFMSVPGDAFYYLKGTHYTTLGVDRKGLCFSLVFLYDFVSFVCQFRAMFLTINVPPELNKRYTHYVIVKGYRKWLSFSVVFCTILLVFYVSSGGCF
jgi:hypothetical protein